MGFETITLEVTDRLAVVKVNRPDKLNALNDRVISELSELFLSLRTRDDVGVVILAGAGEKAFVAGADITELARLNAPGARTAAEKGQLLTLRIETLGKPVICAVQGWALGGGCEIALACTLRIASENAKFGQPEVKLGIIPGYGGSQRLPRLVGSGRALEMILTGEPVSAAEAYRIGLVNRVVAPDQLMAECQSVARKILAVGPRAVEYALEAVNRGFSLPMGEALRLEADLFGYSFATEDMKEGTKAFLEKRPPKFAGR